MHNTKSINLLSTCEFIDQFNSLDLSIKLESLPSNVDPLNSWEHNTVQSFFSQCNWSGETSELIHNVQSSSNSFSPTLHLEDYFNFFTWNIKTSVDIDSATAISQEKVSAIDPLRNNIKNFL